VEEETTPDAGFAVTVTGPKQLSGVRVDMGEMPDVVPYLAPIAPFASSSTKIRGIGHLRHKESDRIAAIEEGLRRLGARVAAGPSTLSVLPSELTPARLCPYGDHRIAMGFALAGFRVPGIEISDPEVVKKSFPGFWERMSALGLRVFSGRST